MKFLSISVFLILASYTYARVITTSLEENHDVEIYKVEEDTDKHAITMINPKSMKPTLREIIYYHLIEKPYDNKETSETSTNVNNLTTDINDSTDSPPYSDYPRLPEIDSDVQFSSDNTYNDLNTIPNSDIILDVKDENLSTHSEELITDIPTIGDDLSSIIENYNSDIVNTNTDIPILEDNFESNADVVNDIKTEYGIIQGDTQASGISELINVDAETSFADENIDFTVPDMEETPNVGIVNYDLEEPIEVANPDNSIFSESDGIGTQMELLSRLRRDISDESHTYGMELSGNHGTVWNDVSARNLKYQVGTDDEVIKNDVHTHDVNDEITHDDLLNTDSEEVNKDFLELDPDMKEEHEVIDEATPLENPEESMNELQEETADFSDVTEKTSDVNSKESPEGTEDVEEVGNNLTLKNDSVEEIEEEKNEEPNEDTEHGIDSKQWGMNLNSESGTVWNDFNGNPIEYQVGNTGSAFSNEIIKYPEAGLVPINNIEISEPNEPVSIEVSTNEQSILDVEDRTPVQETTLIPEDDMLEDNTEFSTLPTSDESVDTVNMDILHTPEEPVTPLTDDIISNNEINNEDTIPEAPTLPPLDLDGFENDDHNEEFNDEEEQFIDSKSISIEADILDDVKSSNEEPNETTNGDSLDIPVDDKVSDEISKLLKNAKFMNWIQTWAAAYSEMIKNKITEVVKEEIEKQLKDIDLECCRTPEELAERTENMKEKVQVDGNEESKIIYGNSVGNENVTNIFLFIDNISDKMVDILKPVIEKYYNSTHYISSNVDPTKIKDTTDITELQDTVEPTEIEESNELTNEKLLRNQRF